MENDKKSLLIGHEAGVIPLSKYVKSACWESGLRLSGQKPHLCEIMSKKGVFLL